MTVAELIKELQKQPSNASVYIRVGEVWATSNISVNLTKDNNKLEVWVRS